MNWLLTHFLEPSWLEISAVGAVLAVCAVALVACALSRSWRRHLLGEPVLREFTPVSPNPPRSFSSPAPKGIVRQFGTSRDDWARLQEQAERRRLLPFVTTGARATVEEIEGRR